MSKKRKSSCYLMIVLAVIFVLCISRSTVSADSGKTLSKEEVLNLNGSALLQYLESNGLELPADYAAHRDAAETFVSTYVPLIVQGQIDWTISQFNSNYMNTFIERLGSILTRLNMVDASAMQNRYSLQNSTVYGSWNSSFTNYNCYAYAIGKTQWLHPGNLSGNTYSDSLTVSELANNVIADLESLGNWAYMVYTKPAYMPDSYFKLICIRKQAGNGDFHFMKAPNSVNNWLHKPGGTWPLQWNYSSPNYCNWSNECVTSNGVAHAPTISYSSSVIYILYKLYGSPGVQPPRSRK